uniref:Aldedh domain-containing protein n=1 Tax=Ascaris lumbricoides TaxID=6252 RepID=A0A0M3ILC3_ASCLU
MLASICQLSAVRDGDLIFFVRHGDGSRTEFEDAVRSVGRQPDVFHVGMFCSDTQSIVHAVPNGGVICEQVDDALQRVDADHVDVFTVHTQTDEVAKGAARWACTRIGCQYNDIFSANSLDSKGVESYYCCQLVVKAYANSGLDTLCPPHTLNFADAQGRILPFWQRYYEERNAQIPQGQKGSHPSKLIVSPHLRRRFARALSHMGKFVVPELVDCALHFVHGSRLAAQTAVTFDVIQPRSGVVTTQCSAADLQMVDAAIRDAQRVLPTWALQSAQQRSVVLRRAASLIRDSLEQLAKLETLDCGKPICESRSDVLSSADCFEFFAGTAHNLAGRHFPLESTERFAYTLREPYGVVAAIGVWNYPMQTASWKIAPALMCGNAVVYKPSPLAPLTSLALALILQNAGLPDGILSIVQGDGETGRLLCEHKGVDKVTFTGSSATGSKVLSACSRLGSLKPATMELGGKSACIVFPDADLNVAVNGALMANFYSQGEVCSNASKVLVHDLLIDEFRERVLAATNAIPIGDPLDEKTRMGALISEEHLRKVKKLIDDARKMGATVLCGGERVIVEGLEGGFYLGPAIIQGVNPNMQIYKEEVFGPVMMLIPFETFEQAIEIANDTPYGLAAGIFTNDMNIAYTAACRLQAGNIYVNTYNDTNAMVPFGGMRQSGFGRENGVAALEAFSQIKSVFVNASKKLDNPFLVPNGIN